MLWVINFSMPSLVRRRSSVTPRASDQNYTAAVVSPCARATNSCLTAATTWVCDAQKGILQQLVAIKIREWEKKIVIIFAWDKFYMAEVIFLKYNFFFRKTLFSPHDSCVIIAYRRYRSFFFSNDCAHLLLFSEALYNS